MYRSPCQRARCLLFLGATFVILHANSSSVLARPKSISESANDRQRGSLYLAKLGNQTRNFQNPLSNIPSVFSEEYKKEESDLAENDFIKALCAKIQGEKPAECTKGGSERLDVPLGLLLLLAILTCYNY